MTDTAEATEVSTVSRHACCLVYKFLRKALLSDEERAEFLKYFRVGPFVGALPSTQECLNLRIGVWIDYLWTPGIVNHPLVHGVHDSSRAQLGGSLVPYDAADVHGIAED
jgi:hypothetical protein